MIDSATNDGDGMASQVCYASLALYSKQKIEEEISAALGATPTLVGNRRGIFSWIFSTQDVTGLETVEDHVQSIRRHFAAHTEELVRLSKSGCEVRVWIYFGIAEVNRSFVLSAELIDWLSRFEADVCVDVWSN